MLDLKFVRENPDIVKQNIKNKFQDQKLPLVDEVIALDAERRAAQQEADQLRSEKNKISKQIGALMAQGKKEEAETVKKQVAADAKKLEELFYEFGAKNLSFKSIVAHNQNSALAHYSKSSKEEILKDGSLVLIDCGAYYEGGLATDITRVFVKGNPTDLQKQVYTTVLKAFLNAYNFKMSEETSGFEIDGLARQIFDENQIDGFVFNHGLGHGLGINVHEAPPSLSLNEIAKTPIKNNMCFTIEPGLYNKEHFGVRLENSCYLENGEIKSFTNMCYEKKLIDFSLLNEQEKEWLNAFEVL